MPRAAAGDCELRWSPVDLWQEASCVSGGEEELYHTKIKHMPHALVFHRGHRLRNVTSHVPGSVFTDLMRTGILQDPYYRFNDVAYRRYCYLDWCYHKTFTVAESVLKHRHINIVLEGLDTIANVTLNNVLLVSTHNMFQRFVIDITDVIKNGSNSLDVFFQSPVSYAESQADMYQYCVPPPCPPPQQKGECFFNFIRKQACSFSWDWGPAFPTVGIWKNVTLIAYDSATINYVAVETHSVDYERWELKVDVTFNVSSSVDGWIELRIEQLGIQHHQRISLNANATTAHIVATDIQAKAWWPSGYGPAVLYDGLVIFSDSQTEVDSRRFKIGFRTVQLVQQSVASHQTGKSFYFRINGMPIFMKGSNWIPADVFPERVSIMYLERLLVSAVEANMNMLRVWGGGVYESEEFYALADRLGLMIWQDLMFACSLYPTNDEFIASVRSEVTHQWVTAVTGVLTPKFPLSMRVQEPLSLQYVVTWDNTSVPAKWHLTPSNALSSVHKCDRRTDHTMLRRLKWHPSIVVWAANNENEVALAENWFNVKSEDYEQYHADYVKLYIENIRGIVMTEDLSRPFVSSSPSNGVETTSEGWIAKNPQSPIFGDVHDYNYSRDSWDPSAYAVPRFASEFGLQSWCSTEALAAVSLPAIDWNLNSSFVSHRQHHPNGLTEMMRELAMNLQLPTSANATQHFIDFVYMTQINQAMGMKTEVELYRRKQNEIDVDGSGLTMGALYWQLNDIWQAPTWSSIEYGGKWKMLHYFAKKFFHAKILSAYIEDDKVCLYYVNDDTRRRFESREGKQLHSSSLEHASVLESAHTSGQQLRHLSETDDVDDSTVHMKQRLDISDPLHHAQEDCTVVVQCFHWNSFQPHATWNITFAQPSVAAKRVYMLPINNIVHICECISPSECLLHFTDATCTAMDAYLPLSKLSAAVGLQDATLMVSGVQLLNKLTVSIDLHSTAIALFVWLDAAGFAGRFSDNGFIMVKPDISVMFHSWTSIESLEQFKRVLTVRSLTDVYT